MNFFRVLLVATTCTWAVLHGQISTAAEITTATNNEPSADYGSIVLNYPDNRTCSLPIPEIKQIFDFSDSGQHCTNNQVKSFHLQNVPSATLIQFYEGETCSDAKSAINFFVKLKTTKQPTTTTQPTEFNYFKSTSAGHLIPGQNIRVEDKWEGSDWSQRDWNEAISCVYIERSQPVK